MVRANASSPLARAESGRGDESPTAEFARLNRRRVFGDPALTIVEVERWQELRETLGQRFGDDADEGPDTLERRKHVRHITHIRVTVDCAHVGIVLNVSRSGLFIATPRPLPLGTEVALQLETSVFDDPLCLIGSVVRVDERGDLTGRCGMAIMFSELEPSRLAALEELISYLESSA